MSTIWEVDDDADEEIEGLDAAGRPVPAYAAALGLIPAPYGRRFLAVTIDVVVYVLTQIPFWVFAFPLLLMFARSEITLYGLVNHPNFILAAIMAGISTLLTLALLIVQGVFHGRMGVTIGKGITGIRTISAGPLAKPGFWRIVLRTLIVSCSNVLPLVGPALFFLSALSDPEKRGRAWHDYAARVWLIDVKKGLDPYDAKRIRIARKVVKVEVAPQPHELPSLATTEDRGIQPGYRPAHSVSAGVLGVAKARRAGRDDSVGIVAQQQGLATSARVVGKDGGAVVGGFRARRSGESPAGGAPAHASQDHRVVMGLPAELATPSAPQPPSPPLLQPTSAPAPQPPSEPLLQPPIAAPQPSSEPLPQPPQIAVRLTLDSGEEYVLSAPTIFGRNPDDNASYGPAQREPVPDHTRTVSKTHFALRPLAEGIEVRDLGSTNGTYLLHESVERQVASGTSLVAVLGDVVRFGDRMIRIGAV